MTPLERGSDRADGCDADRPPDRRGSAGGACAGVAAAAGAWAGSGLGARSGALLAVAGVVAAIAVLLAAVRPPGGRTPVRVVVAVALTATTAVGVRARHADAGLRDPPAGPVRGVATLVDDPRAGGPGGATRVVARLDGRLVTLRAAGGAGGTLQTLAAGERVQVAGTARPTTEPTRYQRARHLVADVRVERAEPSGGASPLAHTANEVRQIIARGASPLAPDQAALLEGIVVGDDRALSPEARDDMLAVGLSHLTAVSGQNVALLLAVLGPVLSRAPLRPRLGLTLGVLVTFAVVTRLEPSVLRATTMAALAAGGATVGRPLGALGRLAWAVAVLLAVDPFLVHRLGFQLSVVASAGMVLGAGPIADRLPGPRPLATAIGVTASAQVAVAPVLLGSGLGVPVASLPANVVIGPLVGAAMTWGMVAAPVVGVAGWTAPVLHVPTQALLGVVLELAARAAALPAGSLGWHHLAALVVGGAAWLMSAPPWLRRAGALVLVASLVLAATPRTPTPGHHQPAVGMEAHVLADGVVVELDGRADTGQVLRAARSLHLRHIDVLVVRSTSWRAGQAADALRRRLGGPDVVLVAAGSELDDATPVRAAVELLVGASEVVVAPASDGLRVSVHPDPGVGQGAPASGDPRPGAR